MTAIYSDLANKRILVTGATRGIGKSIALGLALQKAHVVINYRDGKAEQAKALCDELISKGANSAEAIEFDITNFDQVKEAINDYIGTHGPITALVNNAGISKNQLLMRLKEEDLSQILDTNLKSAIMLTQALTRNFLKAGSVSIVNVSSIVGLMGNPGQVAYAASKAGLLGFTKSLAKELASKKIRANAICPGFIATDMTNELPEKTKESYFEQIPTGRFGTTEEVSNLVNFLLSDASSYITGEVIKIDGGLYI